MSYLLVLHGAQLLADGTLKAWRMGPRQPFGMLLQQRERGELGAAEQLGVLLPPGPSALAGRREILIEKLPNRVAVG